ncbi:MAG: AIR synthase related protein [Acidimicrobiales bacterium]
MADLTLDELVSRLRDHAGLRSKRPIAMVREVFGATDWIAGPGDDGAVVDDGDGRLVVCGEAMYPPFAATDPYGAGVAAVLTNVNDVAAMGGVPLAVVDTIVGEESACRGALEGMRYASQLYQVPIVGGHLTIAAQPLSVAAFAVGRCPVPLSSTAAAPGQRLGLLVCLDGEMRTDFPFFRSFVERGERLGGDVRLLAELAGAGTCVAAKDVSMAGMFGSLAMLLEPSGCGVAIAESAVPCPEGVDLAQWLVAFPCFAFLVCTTAELEPRCCDAAEGRGLSYASLGELDATGRIELARDGERRTVIDLGREDVTGLRSPAPTTGS